MMSRRKGNWYTFDDGSAVYILSMVKLDSSERVYVSLTNLNTGAPFTKAVEVEDPHAITSAEWVKITADKACKFKKVHQAEGY